MNSISYLKTTQRGRGTVVERFAPAMAVVIPAVPGVPRNAGPSVPPAAAGADARKTEGSRP